MGISAAPISKCETERTVVSEKGLYEKDQVYL